MKHTRANLLQRTRRERRGCNPSVPCAGSLDVSRMNPIFMLTGILAILCGVVGCTRKSTTEGTIAPIHSDDEHNRLYKQAADLISPYMRLHGVPEKSVDTAAAQ